MITLKIERIENEPIEVYTCTVNSISLFTVARGKYAWYSTFFSPIDNDWRDFHYVDSKQEAIDLLIKNVKEWLQQEIEVVYE